MYELIGDTVYIHGGISSRKIYSESNKNSLAAGLRKRSQKETGLEGNEFRRDYKLEMEE